MKDKDVSYSEPIGFRDLTTPLQVLVILGWIWTTLMVIGFVLGFLEGWMMS